MKHLKRFNENKDPKKDDVIPKEFFEEEFRKMEQNARKERQDRNLKNRGDRDSDVEPVVVWP